MIDLLVRLWRLVFPWWPEAKGESQSVPDPLPRPRLPRSITEHAKRQAEATRQTADEIDREEQQRKKAIEQGQDHQPDSATPAHHGANPVSDDVLLELELGALPGARAMQD